VNKDKSDSVQDALILRRKKLIGIKEDISMFTCSVDKVLILFYFLIYFSFVEEKKIYYCL